MLFIIASAFAYDPVIEAVGDGFIDWTGMRVVAKSEGRATTGAMTNLEALEGDARAQLRPTFERVARGVRLDRDRVAAALLDGGDLVADRLDANLALWEVYEARYLASGGVELDAALSLQSWLRPALVKLAQAPEVSRPQGGASGVVIDARGTGLEPAIAPELLDETGGHLYGIVDMTAYAASVRGPVVYVSDAADPAAAKRAGTAPVFVDAMAARSGVDIVLGAEAAAALRELAASSDALSRGAVVVVVD